MKIIIKPKTYTFQNKVTSIALENGYPILINNRVVVIYTPNYKDANILLAKIYNEVKNDKNDNYNYIKLRRHTPILSLRYHNIKILSKNEKINKPDKGIFIPTLPCEGDWSYT